MVILTFYMCLQFYLDMKFVICFASQGRFLSRNLQRVINEIISKAMTAFSATGMDPYRYATCFRFIYIIITNIHIHRDLTIKYTNTYA